MNQKIFENIGLSPKESKVLISLMELGSAKLSELGKKVEIPRTSLYPIIQKLSKRGFAHEIYVQNHKEWQTIEPKEIKKIIRKTLYDIESIIPDMEKLREFLPVPKNQSEILYYKSEIGVKKAAKLMLNLQQGERIYGIEGAKAINEKLIRSKSNLDFIQNWQKNFKKNKTILECIIAENSLNFFKKIDAKMLGLYIGRTVITTVLPDEMLDFNVDIYAFRDTLIIISFIENLAIIINNPEVAKVFKILFNIAQQSGYKINLNAHIKELLSLKNINKI